MKREWSDGYVADIGYSHGYFHELAPSYLRYFLLVNGIAPPASGQPYAYCELGYGQGVSANIHAAANPRGEFWGTDFNPDHALHARSLAQEAGVGAHWLDASFEAFIDTPTPMFDFVVLHGVWSWVSAPAQHALVEFMRRKLKPGGVAYLSYNVQPGWNAEKPLRDLLWLYTEHACAPDAPTATRISQALQFARSLRRHGSTFFLENTRASQSLDEMLQQDPGQLAHEYFNRSWWLSYFPEVERALQAAHLNFACSVHLSDVSGEVKERLSGAGFLPAALGTPLRETAADFVLNRRFRRDIFTRGALRLSPAQRLAQLDEVRFALLRPASQVSMVYATPYGQMPLDEARVRPVLEVLDDALQPVPFAALRAAPSVQGMALDELVLLLSRLVGRRDIAPVFGDDAACKGESRAKALNTAIARRALNEDAIGCLASPLLGTGVEASQAQRVFFLGWQEGCRSADDLTRFTLSSGGSDPAPGRALEGSPAHAQVHDQVHALAEDFVETTVPAWKRAGLLDSQRPTAKRK